MSFEFEKESTRIAFRSIRQRKLRSALTVMGIAIGVAAIISMVSIGEGTNAYIQEQFQQLGANKIIVSAFSFGGGAAGIVGGQTLSENDVDLVQAVRGVEDAMPMLYKTLTVEHKAESTTTFVIGLDSADAMKFFEGSQMEIGSGRWLRPKDRYVVVIGSAVADEMFSEQVVIRDKLLVKDRPFEVVGVMKELGNRQDDSQLYIPLETMREVTGSEEEISAIYAQAYGTSAVDEVAAGIQQELDDKYGEKVFSVMSTSTLAGQVTAITGALSLALGGIAGIALLVAGIGIANTMYMSTLERTREIGIMKAVGATNRNIMEIFLVEAAMIGLIGGVVGVTAGTGMSYVLGLLLKSYGAGLKALVTPQLAALGIGFSVFVGTLSGFLPARKASRLNPIDALRYE